MRAGAWPHAAASTSQHADLVRAVATTQRPSVGSRSGAAAQLADVAGRERVEELGIEVRDEPGLGGDDDARGGGARRPASRRPTLEPGRHEVAVVVASSGCRQSGKGSACESPPDPITATRLSVVASARPSGAAELQAAAQAGQRWRERVHDQRHDRDREVGEEVLHGVRDAVVDGQPAGERDVQLVLVQALRADHARTTGRPSSGPSGVPCSPAAIDLAHAEHEGGHEVEPQAPEVVRSDDDGEVRPCRPRSSSLGRGEAVPEHDALDRGARPRPTCVFISVVCDAATPMTMLTEPAPQSLVPTHVPVVRVSTCSICLRKATARAVTAPRATAACVSTSRGPCRGMR